MGAASLNERGGLLLIALDLPLSFIQQRLRQRHGDAAFPEGSGRTFLDTSETRAHALSISERMPLNDKIGPLAERPVRPKVNRSTGKLAFSQSCRGVR